MHFNLKNSHKVKRQKTTQETEKGFNRIFKLSQMETFPGHNHAAALTPTSLSNATMTLQTSHSIPTTYTHKLVKCYRQ